MDEHGTSFIELLCVLLIINIVAAMILPKLTLVDKTSLDYEARYLVSDLRWMQEQSIYRINGLESTNPFKSKGLWHALNQYVTILLPKFIFL